MHGGVQLLVDVLGVDELEATTKKASQESAGKYAIPFAQAYDLAPPSKLRDAIRAALGSASKEDSEIQIVVQVDAWRA